MKAHAVDVADYLRQAATLCCPDLEQEFTKADATKVRIPMRLIFIGAADALSGSAGWDEAIGRATCEPKEASECESESTS